LLPGFPCFYILRHNPAQTRGIGVGGVDQASICVPTGMAQQRHDNGQAQQEHHHATGGQHGKGRGLAGQDAPVGTKGMKAQRKGGNDIDIAIHQKRYRDQRDGKHRNGKNATKDGPGN